jgi:hypothetical protein
MKKRIIATFAVLTLFMLAIAAYAYTTTSSELAADKSCCAKKDSCPMKSKGHDGKDGDHKMSCCSKHGDDHAKGTDHAAGADHKNCDCCGDSCPMKKKDGPASATAAAAGDDKKSCCDDCECCKGAKDTSTV